MSSSIRAMTLHWRTVWCVAQRESFAIIRTKGFWFVSLLSPCLLLPSILLLWSTLERNDRWYERLETGESVGEQLYEGFSSDSIDTYRSFLLWGSNIDPLQYYVVDETAQLKQHIRDEIFEYDARILLPEYYDDGRWSKWGPPTAEDFEDLVNFSTVWRDAPDTSLYRFEEVQAQNVSIETLDDWMNTGSIAAYFILPENFIQSGLGARFVRPTQLDRTNVKKLNALKLWFEEIVSRARQKVILAALIDTSAISNALADSLEFDIHKVHSTAYTDASSGSIISSDVVTTPLANWPKVLVAPFVWLYFMLVLGGANMVLTSTIEEKSSRLAEVLTANAAPPQILDGKLLGSLICFLLGLGIFIAVLIGPLSGLAGEVVGYESDVFAILVSPSRLGTWFLFLLLSLLFLGYIFTAFGSLCNNVKESVMLLYPVHLFNILGVLPAVIYVMREPVSVLAQVLSFVPFFSAPVMISRSSALPRWETYVLIVLTFCSMIFVVRRISVRIFAHGMLSEDSPSSLKQMFRRIQLEV